MYLDTPQVYKGVLLGLQEDEYDNKSDCYLEVMEAIHEYNVLPFMVDTNIANYAKRYVEYAVLLFDIYFDCDLEQLNLRMAHRMGSLSGFTEMSLQTFFRYQN